MSNSGFRFHNSSVNARSHNSGLSPHPSSLSAINCSNPSAQYRAHKEEIDAAISRVLAKGWYILGDEVKAFEKEFAEYIGVSCGIGVGSGTDAIHLALRACGVGSGDEVLTVSHTAVATIAAIEMAGATPVVVDIESDVYTLAPAMLESVISSKTKAIIPVHIYGHPVDLDPLMEIARRYNLAVIEDCAQAHGAMYKGKRVGSFGDMACFSFYPTKNLGAIGDGGMVVTNNTQLAHKTRLLREYGWAERYVSHTRGVNTRLDEIQAAILRVKLRCLDKDNAKRIKLAKVYDKGLAKTGLILPKQRHDSTHVYHLYVVRTGNRDELLRFLKDSDIGVSIHYSVPIHLQPAYVNRLRGCDKLNETESAAREILSLPMYPELTGDEIARVISLIKEFMGRGA